MKYSEGLILEDKYFKKYSVPLNIDPHINIPDLLFPSDLKYVYVKCSIKSTQAHALLFFTTQEANERKFNLFCIDNKGDEMEYKIDMSENNKWHGIINDIDFNPPGIDNSHVNATNIEYLNQGEFSLEYIKICKTPPTYNSMTDYGSQQFINCWSYYSYEMDLHYRELKWNNENKEWRGINPALYIKSNEQSSCNKYNSARKWTCPASGKYKISYKFKQTTDGAATCFLFKRNYKIIDEYVYDLENRNLTGEYVHTLELHKGEELFFEYCNEINETIECIKIEINIEKIE